MTVESATGIWNLVPANPPDGDPMAQGGDHLRLIKQVLQSTFPGITAPVTTTSSDLNATTGLAADVAALASNPLTGTGNMSTPGNLTVGGTLNASVVSQGGYALIPSGIVVMWCGNVSQIPAGWVLCDGTNYTPDLRDRFVIGAGSDYLPFVTGGAASTAPSTSSAGTHNHTGSTVLAGVHSHGGATAPYALLAADIPGHSHTVIDPGHNHAISEGGVAGSTIWSFSNGIGGYGTTGGNYTGISLGITGGSGAHQHTIWGDVGHTHTIPVDGLHSHTVTVPTMPPFYALCFIMKL